MAIDDSTPADQTVRQQKIPTADCAAKTQEIEADGVFAVIACDPIPGEPGWSWIRYKRT